MRRGRLFGFGSCRAVPAARDPPHFADEADERATIRARITFGGTLLVSTGTALHGVAAEGCHAVKIDGKPIR
jgi:hypothetical protein